MHSLTANWFNEMEKLWLRRRTKGFLLVTVLIPVVSALALASLQSSVRLPAGFGSDLPMLLLGLFTGVLLPLFLFMAAADSFTGEVESRTLKLTLVRPISRAKVFASKVLALAAYIIIHLGIVWLMSVLAGSLVTGSLAPGLFESALAYTAAFMPMLAIGLIAVLAAQQFASSGGALGFMIFLYVFGKLLPFLFPAAAVWSVYSYTDWHTLWTGSGASPLKLFHTFVILLAYCMIAYTGSLMLFERRRV
jgi:ABC-2 type transport system permease protein